MSQSGDAGCVGGCKPPEPEDTGRAPRVVDPGGAGWPQEPKVTQAEELLYGEHAVTVRRLGEAAVAAGEAYSFACKRYGEFESIADHMEIGALDDAVQDAWALYEHARAAHRAVAERAVAIVRRRSQPEGADQNEPVLTWRSSSGTFTVTSSTAAR